jgi:hypothetical protein
VTDFDQLKKIATLPTRSVSLCLAGELVEQIAALEAQLAEVARPSSLGDVPLKRVIGEQIAELQGEMRESTVVFRIRAMGARKWSKFWDSMPTREEKESAEAWDDRVFPFYADLVARSCVDPVMSVEQVTELATDILHHKSWSMLANACLNLNIGEIDIPNSFAASELTGSSATT